MKIKLLFLFLLLSGVLFAQKTDYNTAISLLQKIKANDYPESNAIMIENNETNINKQCLGNSESETYTKILTEQGKKRNSVVYFYYDSDYDTVEIKLIEIIKPNASRIKLDHAEILKKISISSLTGFSNIYKETAWLLIGSVPDIEVGDIIHKISNDITHKTYMDNNFFDKINVENYTSILKYYYILNAPKDIKINAIHINKKDEPVKFEEKLTADTKSYICTFDYIPQIIYEPNMDNSDLFSYYIMLTTVDKWEDISTWYYGLVESHLNTNEAMQNKVKELIKDAKTKKEKINNIFYWVAQKVRYLGVDKEKNRPGLEPHDVTYTFETRGGVCRDKAALLVAMLRLAEIPCDPILISIGSKLNHKAPCMMFNHAVAVSYDENGKPEYFLDPTSETTKDLFPQYEEDNTFIIARKQGADLQVVPVSPASRNNTNIDLKISVDKDNNANGSIKVTYSGLADTFIRSKLMKNSRTKRKEFLQKLISNINPGAVIKEYKISNPEDKKTNIYMTAEFEIPEYVNYDKPYSFVPFEASKLSLSFIYEREMETFNLSERNYPFKLNNTFSVDINESISFVNPVAEISIPENINLDYKGFKMSSTGKLSEDKKQADIKVSFKAEKIHFSKDDYKDLKLKLSELEKLEKLYIISKTEE